MLVTAPQGSPIFSVNNGTTINLATLSTRSISMSFTPSGPIGSLKIRHNGQDRMENFAPYSLNGDTNGAFNPANLTVGSHTVTLTPYSQPDLNGSSGAATTITFQVVDNPAINPVLVTEDNSDFASAINATTFMRGPFPVLTNQPFSADKRTRLLLFVTDFATLTNTTRTQAVVRVENASIGTFNLPIERLDPVPGFNWLTQIEVILPASLANAADWWVTVRLNGVSTNQARLKIKQAGSAAIEPPLMNLFKDPWILPDLRFLWSIPSWLQNG